MRSMHYPVCGTVAVRSLKGKTLENTCSGFIVDSCTGYFLTHGTILSEHIEAKSKLFQELQRKLYCTGKEELKHLQLDVEVKLPKNVFPHLKSSSPNMELSIAPSSAVMEGLHGNQCSLFHGRVCSIFSVPSLKHILNRLMPSDNWEFGDEQTNKNKKEKSDSLIFRELLSCFILIQLDDWMPFHSTLSIKSSSQNSIGDPVEIISTPFGGLIPEVFLNARSSGIISNVAGKGKVLLMTDARCVPGSEGGILVERNSSRSVLGVIIATLCWKNSEWVGLSLACALPDIMTAIEAIPVNVSPTVLSLEDRSVSDLQQVLPLVPLISVRGSWGSGFTVGIHGNEVILLTCNHVVKDYSYGSARVKWPSGNIYSGELIYKNHSTPTFDLALMSVKVRSSDISSTLRTATVQEGEPVFGVGHAIFNEEYDLLASVTSGIVSKVHRMRNKIVMIQTTCAIHAGASGGPVVNKQGEVIGVTVCNAKDVTSGASYPHVNMCVPMETILPFIQQFLQTKDPSVLEGLQIQDPSVVGLWNLETGPRAPIISSKL